jgi:hypothetical protein
MAFSFPQTTAHRASITDGEDFVSQALGGAIAADDALDVEVSWESPGDEAPVVADNLDVTNVYNEKASCRTRDTVSGISITVFACKVVVGGTPTITATFPGVRNHKTLTITPIRGASLTGTPPQQGAGQVKTVGPPSSGNITPGSDGALVISSVRDVENGTNTVTLEGTSLSETMATDGCATQYEIQGTDGPIAGDFTFTLFADSDSITVVRSYAVAVGTPVSVAGVGYGHGVGFGILSMKPSFITVRFQPI